MTIKSTIETLSEAALDLVVGGIWDNPWSDQTNQRRAAQNSADGTFGGSLNGVLVGETGPHGGVLV